MQRRQFTKAVAGLIGAGALTGIYAWQIEPFWLEFVKVNMPVKNLPKHLEGRTLMQLSDMHVGNRFDWNYLINSMRKAQELNPDFVVYTGDFVSYENSKQLEQLKQVAEHTVKGRLGTFGILGNHDYGHAWAQEEVAQEICIALENAGITMLRNQIASAYGLNFIGLDDYWAINFNPEQVLAKHDASQANIVLCHNPDVCDLDVWHNYRGWVLSGHTHGGQCKPPFLDPPILPVKNERYTAGRIDLKDGRQLYINRALGNLYQIRFNVRPEITLFTLEMA